MLCIFLAFKKYFDSFHYTNFISHDFRQLGNFYDKLGLIDAAKDVFKELIKQLEHKYGETDGTIVQDSHSQSWSYKCKHPTVIEVMSAVILLSSPTYTLLFM